MNRCRRCYLALILTLILGLREGNIALWNTENGICLRRFPYRTETLPPSVQAVLEDGVPFSDMEQALETAQILLS